MAIILMPKLTGKCAKICQKIEKIRFFAAYTAAAAAACWPRARLG